MKRSVRRLLSIILAGSIALAPLQAMLIPVAAPAVSEGIALLFEAATVLCLHHAIRQPIYNPPQFQSIPNRSISCDYELLQKVNQALNPCGYQLRWIADQMQTSPPHAPCIIEPVNLHSNYVSSCASVSAASNLNVLPIIPVTPPRAIPIYVMPSNHVAFAPCVPVLPALNMRVELRRRVIDIDEEMVHAQRAQYCRESQHAERRFKYDDAYRSNLENRIAAVVHLLNACNDLLLVNRIYARIMVMQCRLEAPFNCPLARVLHTLRNRYFSPEGRLIHFDVDEKLPRIVYKLADIKLNKRSVMYSLDTESKHRHAWPLRICESMVRLPEKLALKIVHCFDNVPSDYEIERHPFNKRLIQIIEHCQRGEWQQAKALCNGPKAHECYRELYNQTFGEYGIAYAYVVNPQWQVLTAEQKKIITRTQEQRDLLNAYFALCAGAQKVDIKIRFNVSDGTNDDAGCVDSDGDEHKGISVSNGGEQFPNE